MATQNVIDSGKPIEVADGGTGVATFTDHGVLVGSGTGAITALAVGATGTLLVGTNGSDPAFATSATGNFSFTSSTSAVTRTLTISNTDNTNSASSALLKLEAGGASAGDPVTRYTIDGTISWMVGIDNDDDDNFKIATHNTDIGTNSRIISTVDGEITRPSQPAFGAVASDQSNATGDGTVYSVTFTSSEYFDQNSDFDGTSTFTAPVSGRYQFQTSITIDNIGSHSSVQMRLFTSNRTYFTNTLDPSSTKNASNEYTIDTTLLVDMDAADTAIATVYVAGSTKTIGILGVATFFNGMLVC